MLTRGRGPMQFTEPVTRAFLAAAHRMTAEHVITKAERELEIKALLTMLEETTQSRSIAARCAKAKGAL